MILSLFFFYHALATSVLVRQDDEICFWEDVIEGEEFHHSYEITAGPQVREDVPGVQVRLFDSDDNIIIDLEQDRDNEALSFTATKDGAITWCYKNWSQEMITVDWDVHVGNAVLTKNVAGEKHINPMQSGVS